jgi:RNA polymerase sigma-70 factor (ECF subfamily)
LCVIARNHAINISKKRSLEGGISLDDEQLLLQVADEVILDIELADAEFRREVIKAIEGLGEPDSSIVFRKYYYGESSKEIAKTLGLSVSNVDTRTHRALNKLRKKFGGDEG